MNRHSRKSTRLRGYDYRELGAYFVTICTADRQHLLGDVIDGTMRLSRTGGIVVSCWNEIPAHFPGVYTGPFQVMPNHVHGIIEIKETAGAQHAAPQHGSLGTIIRSFKSAVTKQAHELGLIRGALWQRNYHDHIIRDDVDYYFAEQYIALNPLMWEIDINNPERSALSPETLRQRLKEEHGLDGLAAERVIESMKM